jgi:hypothetical protein
MSFAAGSVDANALGTQGERAHSGASDGYTTRMEGDPNPKVEGEADSAGSNLEKDPSDWVTGDEPMTGAQASYLKTLSEQAGESFDSNMTKAQASQRIDELRERRRRTRR